MTVLSASSIRRLSSFGLFCLLSAGNAGAETFRVGIGTGCTHLTVEAAVAAAAANGSGFDEIYIAYATQTLGSFVEVDSHSVALVGGFSSCTAVSPTGQTTLRRFDPTDAFSVHSASGTAVFSLERITVDMGVSAKRALRLEGDVQAIFIDSVLTDGQAPLGEDGGNVWMSGDATLALIRSTDQPGRGQRRLRWRHLLRERRHRPGRRRLAWCGRTRPASTAAASSATTARSKSGAGSPTTSALEAVAASTPAGAPRWRSSARAPKYSDVLEMNQAGENGGGLYSRRSRDDGDRPQRGYFRERLRLVRWRGHGRRLERPSPWMSTPQPARSGAAARNCSAIRAGVLGGGAIYVTTGSSAEIRQTTIRWGRADRAVGSVAIVLGTLLIESCEIYDNDALVIPDVSRLPRRRVVDDRLFDHRRNDPVFRRLLDPERERLSTCFRASCRPTRPSTRPPSPPPSTA